MKLWEKVFGIIGNVFGVAIMAFGTWIYAKDLIDVIKNPIE